MTLKTLTTLTPLQQRHSVIDSADEDRLMDNGDECRFFQEPTQ